MDAVARQVLKMEVIAIQDRHLKMAVLNFTSQCQILLASIGYPGQAQILASQHFLLTQQAARKLAASHVTWLKLDPSWNQAGSILESSCTDR